MEALFTNRLDVTAHPYFEGLAGVRVSSHFFLRRHGELVQFVHPDLRAWHAGVSRLLDRERCNDFPSASNWKAAVSDRSPKASTAVWRSFWLHFFRPIPFATLPGTVMWHRDARKIPAPGSSGPG